MSRTGTLRESRRMIKAAIVGATLIALVLAFFSPIGAWSAAAVEPTVTISGVVSGSDASAPPIAGATARLSSDANSQTWTATTDASGEYALYGVPLLSSGYKLSVTPPTNSGYLPASVSPIVPNPSTSNVVNVTVPLGARIDGTVVQTNGKSVAGATLTVSQGSYVVTSRTLGAEGVFTLVGLTAGSYRVQVTLEGSGTAYVELPNVVIGQAYPVHLVLNSPGVLSGTVTSKATGEALSGIEVHRLGQSAVTGADGRYVLRGATIGSYRMTFFDPLGAFVAFQTEPITVASAQSIGDVDAALETAGSISGTVLAADGTPLPGVVVGSPAFPSDESGLTNLSGLSDYQGHYRITGVPAGTWSLVGTPSDQTKGWHLKTAGPTVTVESGEELTDVDFPLDAFTLISGTLTRSAPVEGDITKFSISFHAVSELFPDLELPYSWSRGTHPDASGHYELRVPPGRYVIRIAPPRTDDGYATSYNVSSWENIQGDFDYEYPSTALGSGTKVFVVERNTPANLDLQITRGDTYTSTPYPAIEGSPVVGQTLTASPGAWQPVPDNVRYEWRRDYAQIEGATGLDYSPTEADVGHTITFAVTATSSVNGVATVESAPVTVTRGLSPTPKPTIDGDTAIGSTLTANAGTWGPAPVTLSYQWTRNGTLISGATSATYVLQTVDAGKKIGVTVTGSKSGYPSVSQSSATLLIPVPPPSVERIAGADRYEESALISQRVAPNGSALVYLASGENFSDALSGSAIAAQHDAPLLLSSRASIPNSVASEIGRLNPSDIVVLGGANTLTADVIAQLNSLVPTAEVHRIGGADRYEVSRNLIKDPQFGAAPSSRLFVATGRTFPDALSASPAAALLGAPVLLIDGQRTAFTAAERQLLRDRGVTAVTTFGGAASISGGIDTQLTKLGITVTRISGADRYAVSLNTAKAYFRVQNHRDVVYLASGATFPDALAGGVLAGYSTATPIFLAQNGCLDQGMMDHITGLQAKKIVILGGPNSIGFNTLPFPACPARG